LREDENMPGESNSTVANALHAMRNWLLPLNAEISALTARARGQDPEEHCERQVSPAEAVAAFLAQHPKYRQHRAGLIAGCEKMPAHQLALSQAKWRELAAARPPAGAKR
jgi:hypothetical protein